MNSPKKKPYRYITWQNLLILFTLLFLLISALPNLYGDRVTIQLSPINSSVQQLTTYQLKDLLAKHSLSVDKIHSLNQTTSITLSNKTDLKSINELLFVEFNNDYNIENSVISNSPLWLQSLDAKPIKLGLDLSGGVLFVLEVDTKQALLERFKNIALAIKTLAMEERIRGVNVVQSKLGLSIENYQQNLLVSFPNVEKSKIDLLFNKIKAAYPELSQQKNQNNQVTLSYSSQKTAQYRQETMQQTLKTMRGRIAELGITEAVTLQQGKNYIRIELPGVHDPDEAKRIIGATASLDFYQLAENSTAAGILRMADEHGRAFNLNSQVVFSGSNIKNARAGQDQMSMPLVNLTLDAIGGKKMSQFSKQNIGNTMVTVFSEFYRSADDKMVKKSKIINVATIQQHLGSQFSITHMPSQQAAQELSLLLRAGSLTAPVTIVKQRTIEATLGENNIKNGIKALSIGMGFTLVFMAFWYRALGLIANVALTLNLMSLLGLMSLLPGAVLTLPGIAGLVLTVGMAVDTNVLIFERIKEELKRGHKVLSAVEQGYKSAFSTILDANITTMITGIILYTIGNGPVKGFALILCLGILTSMFTGVFVSKSLTNLVIRKNKAQLLGVNV
ncbi:protein translocase subunit SecD [Colwellia hornerae]|uniref:Protein translocase subunit SecD n=2 Tax=Colwellia hornerae TaxID=89402 RepID=A0A5C6QG41_9GAMM|nr:protein translocase subunit SecD [Colwellia hornerae]TWX57885.1 protein translocase subunit SecD [Colwellia hornerae]TWX67587.1 protein translocase subunit SecD [Colwellia hornerae]